MKFFLILIFLLFSNLFSFDEKNNFTFDPFKSNKKIKYSLNDFSNYPIGIFDIYDNYFDEEIKLNLELGLIEINKKFINQNQLMPYISEYKIYSRELVNSNQKFNLTNYFQLTSSDTSATKKNDSFVEIASLDLGALGTASLRVQGNVNLSGKLVNQDQEMIRSSYKDQEKTNFKFDQKQQLNVQGKIGDQITVSLDQNSERDFDWENTIRVDYVGKDDDILQKLELGNISLSLPATDFVTFSGQNQGLFGVKALAKLGPVDITSIASLEKTKKQSQQYKGTSEARIVEILDYEYKRNVYFFIHEWFRNGSNEIIPDNSFNLEIPSFYPLVNGLHQIGNVIVSNFELYKIDASNNPKANPGIAYINPNDLTQDIDQSKEGTFIRLERGSDYIINEDLGFIRMQKSLQNEIIAAHFDLVDRISREVIYQVGSTIDENNSSLVLKMIKAQSPHPNHPTWDLMFKNVYSLNNKNIDPENLEVQIVDNFSTPISDRNSDDITFLNLFGLDNVNKTGSLTSDDIIDFNNPNIVNLRAGEIHLPSLLPFVSDNDLNGGNNNSSLNEYLQNGTMYTSSNFSEYSADSRFTIIASYLDSKKSINLGFTLVEGSEEITSNGEKLSRGEDYQVDYFSGTIIFNENINPDSDIRIAYDKHDFVTFDRKFMLGSRAQIDFDQNSFLGMTALYYNQDVINNKVEVGNEPLRNFIWDINGRFEKDIRSIDKLSFINSDKISTFSIEGEIAQVLPNPNSLSNPATGDKNGVAYIDDFEGSKRTTNPSIQRRFWELSSAPINEILDQEFDQKNRLKMYWYNPYSQVLTNSIWPNVSTSQKAQNLTTDILVLNYAPKELQASTNPDSLWAGITAPMFIGDYDQTRSKFFEIWVRGDNGKLTIDLGRISEDYDGNGILNSEDVPEAGLALGNGFLEDNEDTGLDGCFNDFENGYGGCLDEEQGLTYAQLLANGEQVLINTSSDIDLTDPNGDDWFYSEGSSNYEKVNGTEGNGSGDRIQTGGKYPDSEDLDQSGFLDKANNYFTKTISLDNNKYLAGSTEINGIPTGWKLLRIPLSDFNQVDDITLSEIRYIRLVVSGINEPTKLEIAKIELVGNTWQELGTAMLSNNDYVSQDSTFVVSVINDEDNPNYIPPKGVFGDYDRVNQIQSKEQSLVLKFNNLASNYKGAAKKIISMDGDKGQSYLMYDKMKLFIHGNSDYISQDDSDIRFFIQFGNGEEYYKLTKTVYDGWDEELKRNEINLDLNWLSKLKNVDTDSIELLSENDIFQGIPNYKKYSFINSDGIEYKNVEIVGNPSLSRLQYFVVGVENISNQPISGELWLDELRLSGVKKDSGTAMRLKSSFNLSDFGKSTISYLKRDADFHVLQERLGSGNTVESFSLTNNIQIGKLFPKNLGISFPIDISYMNTNNTPKYFPGTDIASEESAPDSIIVKSQTIKINGNISKKVKSENPLIKYSIDNLNLGFNLNTQEKSDIQIESQKIDRLNTNLNYNLRFQRDNYIQIFGWTEKLPFLGNRISDVKFFYSPTNFNSSMRISRFLSDKVTRKNNTRIEDFNIGLTRTFSLNYKIFDNTSFQYNKNLQSDLSDYRDEVLSSLKSGSLTNINESLNFNFSPQWIKFFKADYIFISNYNWNKPLNAVIDAANLQLSTNSTLNFSISPKEVFDIIFINNSENDSDKSPERTRTRSTITNSKSENKLNEENIDGKRNFKIQNISNQLNKIDTINFTISNSNNNIYNGINSDIPASFRLGLNQDYSFESVPEIGLNSGNKEIRQSFTARTGYKFNNNSSLSLSFNESTTSNLNGYGVNIKTSNRDYFSYGKYLSKGFPFSNWSLRVGGLEKINFIKNYVNLLSVEHVFSGKQNLSWKFNDGANIKNINLLQINSFENNYAENIQFSRTTQSFSPLIGFTTSFNNGVTTNVRSNLSYTLDKVPNGKRFITDNSLLTSLNYNFSSGLRMSLPFSDRNIYLKNNINIALNFDFSSKKEEGSKDNTNFIEQNFSETKKSVLRITYTITEDITGSLFYEYRENDSRLTGRRIDRDFGINFNVAIRG